MGVHLSSVRADLTSEEISALKVTQAASYIAVSMMTLATWEWGICSRMEWFAVWKAPWSPIKVLYLLSRTLGILTAITITVFFLGSFTQETCQQYEHVLPTIGLIVTLVGEVILAMRVIALWNWQRLIVGIVAAFIVLEVALGAYATSHFTIIELPDDAKGCFLWMYWAIPAALDSLLFALTAVKVRMFWKEAGGATPLLRIVFRDGLLYFAAAWVLNITNLIANEVSNGQLTPVFAPLVLVLVPLLCCRLVLNLRLQAPGAALDSRRPGVSGLTGVLMAERRKPELHNAIHVQIDRVTAIEEEKDGDRISEGHSTAEGSGVAMV